MLAKCFEMLSECFPNALKCFPDASKSRSTEHRNCQKPRSTEHNVSLSWRICLLHTPRVYIRNIFPKALLLQTLLLFEPIIVIFSWSDRKWPPRRPDGRLDAQTAVWTRGRPSGRPNGRQEAQTAVWTTRRPSRRPNGRLDAQMAV